MDANELKKIVTECLIENGVIKPEMTRAEIIEWTSRARYEKAVKSGLLKRKKNPGKNAAVKVNRLEVMALINSNLI